MFGLIIPFLSGLISPISNFFKRKQELIASDHATQLAFKREDRLAQKDVVAANLKRGTQQLKATGRFFKYFTFCLWFGPFAAAFVAPEYSIALFERLAALPDWYVQSCMVIIFAIWGISSSRETIANIFKGLGTFMLQRQASRLNISLAKGTMLPPSESNLPSKWPNPDKVEND